MFLARSSHLIRTAALGLLAVLGIAFGATGFSVAHAETGCTPRTHPDAITTLTLSDTTLQGSQTVRIDFAGALPDGSCAGDTVTLTAPPSFPLNNGEQTLRDSEGAVVGSMVVADNVVTITFGDYVETHNNVTFGGRFYGHLAGSTPGSSYELVWNPGGGTITTPVTTNLCEGCSGPRTRASKSASLTADHEIKIFLDSVPALTAGEVVTFTDVVGPGQQMDCTRFRARAVTGRAQWGGSLLGADLPFTVVSCNDQGFTVTVAATAAGEAVNLSAYALTTEDRATYPDSGTVSQAGRTDDVSATAREYTADAEGSGDLVVDDEETQTANPTPTPTATPTATVTPTVPEPSPTAPATTTSTTTIEPSPTAPTTTKPGDNPPTSGGPSPKPPATTGPTPEPPLKPKKPDILPETGSDSTTRGLTAVGTTLLAAGVFLVCATRRRVNPS